MHLQTMQDIREELRSNYIKRISELTFQLIIEGEVTCEGSEAIIRRTAEAHSFENVVDAFNEMLLNDHNRAEFGINRIFMYTKQDSTFKSRKFDLIQ